jgi:hypothetical protein
VGLGTGRRERTQAGGRAWCWSGRECTRPARLRRMNAAMSNPDIDKSEQRFAATRIPGTTGGPPRPTGSRGAISSCLPAHDFNPRPCLAPRRWRNERPRPVEKHDGEASDDGKGEPCEAEHGPRGGWHRQPKGERDDDESGRQLRSPVVPPRTLSPRPPRRLHVRPVTERRIPRRSNPKGEEGAHDPSNHGYQHMRHCRDCAPN